jgi:molybdopterin-guanine dinucleotide biosynthesis protein A
VCSLPGNVYYQRVDDLTAFVLAGGRSSRMGQDKAFLNLGGRTLLELAVELAGTVAENVRIVASQERFLTIARTIEDVYPDCGPLGGIHAALSCTSTELNLVLAVDLPFVEADFLAYLAAQASQTSALVTVPQAAGGWQPLCAVYRRDFAAVAEKALQRKRNKIDRLFVPADTRVIHEAEMQRMNFPPQMFRNLNTPKEFENAEKASRHRRS